MNDNDNTTSQQRGLINLANRTPEERAEIARQGGIKSAEVKKEKKLLSQIYAEIIAELYDITDTDDPSLKTIVKEVLKKGDAATVSMLRTMGEMTENKKVDIGGNINITIIDDVK